METIKISAMPASVAVSDGMRIPVVSGGQNSTVTVEQLRNVIASPADWSGTQREYNLLAKHDAGRWYVIKDSIDGHTMALYRGDTLITAEPNMVGQFSEDSNKDDWFWWPNGVKTPLPVDPATKRFSFYYPVEPIDTAGYLFNGGKAMPAADLPECKLVSLERMPFFRSGDTYNMFSYTSIERLPTLDLRYQWLHGNRPGYIMLNNRVCKEMHFKNTENAWQWTMVIGSAPAMRCVTGIDFTSAKIATAWPFGLTFAYLDIVNLGKAAEATSFQLNSTNWGNDAEWRGARKSLTDTLITNSFDRTAAGYQPVTIELSAYTFGLLTEQEKATISAKGFTLTVTK